jgi:hypothetical protein
VPEATNGDPGLNAVTFVDLVKSVAAEYGTTVTSDEATDILWEHTGFPGFIDGDPKTVVRDQLRQFFAETDGALVPNLSEA